MSAEYDENYEDEYEDEDPKPATGFNAYQFWKDNSPAPEPKPKTGEERERDTQPRLNLDEKIEVDGQEREIEIHDCGLYVFKAGEKFSPPPPSPQLVVHVTMQKHRDDDVQLASSHNKYTPSGLIAPVSRGYQTVQIRDPRLKAELTKKVK